jgi:hypothetical protein
MTTDSRTIERQPKLGLYTHLLPQAAQELRREDDAVVAEHIGNLARAVPFDCRHLPREFVLDTGDALFEQNEAIQEPIRLPYPCCYFEFADERAVCAIEYAVYAKPDATRYKVALPLQKPEHPSHRHLGTVVHVYQYSFWEQIAGLSKGMSPLTTATVRGVYSPVYGEFLNEVPADDDTNFFRIEIPDWVRDNFKIDLGFNITEDELLEYSTRFMTDAEKLLLGVLTLLRDRLVVDHVAADPNRWWNHERRKKGKLPTSGDTHVLTVNVPAIQRVASATSGTHESPALHWRRGHWRTLHRASERETRTWVRCHLVGDPSKGFIRSKSYLLVADDELSVIDE